MKKQFVILGVSVLLLTITLCGCINNNTQTDDQKDSLLYVVTGTGVEDENYVYVDIQNIDTEEGDFTVEFYLTYIDSDELGGKTYGGGTSPDGSSGDIEYNTRFIHANIAPHETERVRCPKHVPSGYVFGGWDFEIIPPYKVE